MKRKLPHMILAFQSSSHHRFNIAPKYSLPYFSLSSSSSSLESSVETNSHDQTRIGVIGGGASGMFAATAAADAASGTTVIVFEGTSKTMSKVRISGGGRCNGKSEGR